MIDFTDLTRFEARVDLAATRIDVEAEIWARHWGDRTVEAMQETVAKRTRRLERSIRQTAAGQIEIGEDYWVFLERGTSTMAPQPFVGPAVRRVSRPATEEAGNRALRLLTR